MQKQPELEWPCSMCTFLNKAGDPSCALCGNSNFEEALAKAMETSKREAFFSAAATVASKFMDPEARIHWTKSRNEVKRLRVRNIIRRFKKHKLIKRDYAEKMLNGVKVYDNEMEVLFGLDDVTERDLTNKLVEVMEKAEQGN